MNAFFKNLFTLSDNNTYSVGTVGGAMALMAHIGYTGYDLMVLHHAFAPHTFGVGVGTILGGMMVHQRWTDPSLSGGGNAPSNPNAS